ncbi:MAG: UDP-N-acetylmuramate--L-alanine ligase, partial [Alphaproteobacteria bacterium]
AMPLSIGVIHFVGIGGIGMSGIAEILHNLGYQVQGSDVSDGANVLRLRDLGVAVAIGHDAANIDGAQVIVVSSAINPSNPEVVAAKAQMIPVVRRAEMLAELMRLKWSIAVGGTHGKTTTTSMITSLLEAAELDPTVINGGIINAYGTNARLGDGEWMVVEADESDGTFTKLPATIAVVTNLDPEHLDHYGTFEAEKDAFQTFIQNIPFYGFAVLCIDHADVQALIGKISDRRIITYGFSPQAEIRGRDLRIIADGTMFDVDIETRNDGRRTLEGLVLPMFGEHNVANALAAIAVAQEMNLPDEKIAEGLRRFSGVKRRFTKTGVVNGVTIIDDYGHHPVEIAAVLNAARGVSRNRVIAVVQPHRFSRLMALFEEFCTCFNDADTVIVAPVHAAGEDPIDGIDGNALVEGLQARGHRYVEYMEDPSDLSEILFDMMESGDYVLCLGAGTITNWAQSLPDELRRLSDAAKETARLCS